MPFHANKMDTANSKGPSGPDTPDTALPAKDPTRSFAGPASEPSSTARLSQGKQPRRQAAAAKNKAAAGPPPQQECFGVRAYDGGFFDVGSFFLFHNEPPTASPGSGRGASSEEEDDHGEDDLTTPRRAADQAASPLGYVLLDGLAVTWASGGREKEVDGQGSDGALRAFLELQRQVCVGACCWLFEQGLVGACTSSCRMCVHLT